MLHETGFLSKAGYDERFKNHEERVIEAGNALHNDGDIHWGSLVDSDKVFLVKKRSPWKDESYASNVANWESASYSVTKSDLDILDQSQISHKKTQIQFD